MRTLLHARWRDLDASDRCAVRAYLQSTDELQATSGIPPSMTEAHRFVQRILSVHDKRHLHPEQAHKRLLKAWSALPDSAKIHFRTFATALNQRTQEYLNTWAHGAITNGRAEAQNMTLRDLHRAGRGLSLEELRRRAIFTMSPTELIERRTLELLGPIDQILSSSAKVGASARWRTVSRHGTHRRGRRDKQAMAQQLELFSID